MSGFGGDSADRLRFRLNSLGLSREAVEAAWPRWWSDDADESPSARAELRLGVARRLGLDPRSLLDDQQEPRFLWQEEARFKHLSNEGDLELAGITSFGRAVAALLQQASAPAESSLVGATAQDLRQQILGTGRPFVDLADLLSLCWAVEIPVVHLQVFPWPQKRMAAMTVRLGDRWSILLGKEAQYPAPIAFYLAHEIAHIALGHVEADRLIVDLEGRDDEALAEEVDDEERAADAFALELLTGEPQPKVLPESSASAQELARVALEAGPELQIEPGTLAEIFGHSTGKWHIATASLKLIYDQAKPVSAEVNRIARNQLNLDELPGDGVEFLDAVLGPPE